MQAWEHFKEKKVDKITNLIYDELDYMYCNNCRFNDELNEEECSKQDIYWGCENCHRKYNGWGISKEEAEKIATKILKEID